MASTAEPAQQAPPGSHPTLEVDDAEDADFAFGDGAQSSTTSIASSIMNFQFENGRRYHAYKPGHYPWPNDEAEQDRLDLQHHIFTLMLDGKLHLAPLESPRKVLDVGAGTGIWAIEFADQFPSTEVIGTDLSPTQPKWVPPNLQFEIDDFESEWTFKADSFDYIHARYLIGSISDWEKFIGNCYKHVKPGGYFELQELDPYFAADDGTLPADSVQTKWVTLMCDASLKYGRPVPHYNEFKPWVEEAGFEDVHEIVYKIPMNPWPKSKQLKQIGQFQLTSYAEGLEGLSMGLFTRVLNWSIEELQVLLSQMRTEMKDRKIHSYQRISVLYGRKPRKAS